jgi:hypothetical protein
MNEISRIAASPARALPDRALPDRDPPDAGVKLLPWAPERNGEAPPRLPPPRPGFWARLAIRIGLHA